MQVRTSTHAFIVAIVDVLVGTGAWAQQAYDPARQASVPSSDEVTPRSAPGGSALGVAPSRLFGINVTDGSLLDIDPATGTGTFVAFTGGHTIAGLAWDRTTGLLFGTDTGTQNLVRVNPTNGATTVVGNTGLSLPHGMAIHPYTGVIYAAALGSVGSALYTLDRTTGASTLVGNIGFPDVDALDFDPTTGILYAGTDGSFTSTYRLLTIDIQTGAGTQIGLTHRINGLAFDASGSLFATENNFSMTGPSVLLSVDKNTAAWSFIGNIVAGNVLGASFSQVYAVIPFCFGDGSVAPCPCGNAGGAGRGCQNSAGTGGAMLTASGIADLSADTLQLTASGELPNSLNIVQQGDAAIAPAIFGDGLRCAGGQIKRLRVENAVGGTMVYPDGAETPIHLQSANQGDPIPQGAARIYQVHYRDPNLGFCPTPLGNTFNATNAIGIAWSP